MFNNKKLLLAILCILYFINKNKNTKSVFHKLTFLLRSTEIIWTPFV